MNLVIGNTSQLSHYFPEDYIKISSRNIDFEYLKNNNWDSVYITFSEQRIYDSNIDYITPNYFYTLSIIDSLLHNSNKIVCYTSCELWGELSGCISLQTKSNFSLNNEYAISKLLLWNKITNLRKANNLYNKVVFIHPFYFNSVRRSKYFLFGKIFDSIINKQKIIVNNLNFYRDMVHAKFVVQQSIKNNQDAMVGAGKLFNIRDFIIDLYKANELDFKDLVHENTNDFVGKEKLIMAKTNSEYTYQNLLQDTQEDILNYKERL